MIGTEKFKTLGGNLGPPELIDGEIQRQNKVA